MAKLRMRTKFLLSMLLISAGLTSTSLLVVQHSLQKQTRKNIESDLQNSVGTFKNFQQERELTLTRSAELLADLPILRALMTAPDAATIQDASDRLWQTAGSDLFVLIDRAGRVVALHTSSPGFTTQMAKASFAKTFNHDAAEHWWFGGHHLYEVFLKPIYFGPAAEDRQLGFLIVGYEIDERVASQVSRIASSQVVFYYADDIVRSTLPLLQESELVRQSSHPGSSAAPEDLRLGDEQFLSESIELAGTGSPSVRLSVLKSYDEATAFLDRLNRLLLALGLAAVALGSALVFLISDTFTRPLGKLVAGVRALEHGDFTYRLEEHGSDEVAELTGAFNRMRGSLLQTQRELLDSERLATIGRMASSISHDLRHSLAAIVANAEFLCESRLSGDQREELYQEIRIAVNQMTDLIDSLLEFSRTRESLRRTQGNLRESAEHAIQTFRSHPERHNVNITVVQTGAVTGWFDARKMERVFYNLLLNAFESLPPEAGAIQVKIDQSDNQVQVRVVDNGRGIAQSVRETLFDPFVSIGKENGTGLGLTIVQKIVQDHGGEVVVESSSPAGTTFKIDLPMNSPSAAQAAERGRTSAASLTQSNWPPTE
ncbi:MAG: two-component sensor histidine kinase [Acidobacteria bacterium]|jgi:signal transduction histidine kinase|nr:MAG: two-component sensor histidine kinase [Acidobacteriota bacterium]